MKSKLFVACLILILMPAISLGQTAPKPRAPLMMLVLGPNPSAPKKFVCGVGSSDGRHVAFVSSLEQKMEVCYDGKIGPQFDRIEPRISSAAAHGTRA